MTCKLNTNKHIIEIKGIWQHEWSLLESAAQGSQCRIVKEDRKKGSASIAGKSLLTCKVDFQNFSKIIGVTVA